MNSTPMLKTATGILVTLVTCAAHPAHAQAQAPVPPPPPPAKPAAATIELERWTAPDNAFAVSYPKGWEPKQLPDNAAGGGAGGAAVASPVFTNTADAADAKPDTFWVATAGLTTVNLPPPPSTPNRPSAPNRPTPPRPDAPPAPAPVRNFRAWAKAVREGVAQKVTDFKLVSENQASLGGTVALRLIFDSKQDKGGDTVRMIQWICEKGDKAYVLTFMFDPKRMTKVIPVEQAVSRSFVFAPKDAATDTGGHKVATEPTPYEDKARGFRLNYPPGWGKAGAQLPGVSLALGKSASAGKVAQLLMVMANPLEPNEQVTLKLMEGLLDKILPAAGLKDAKTAEATDIKLGGEPARRLLLTGTRQADEHAIRALGVVALHNRTAVILIGAAPVEDFDAFATDFDKVTESFAFLDASPPAADAKAPTADAKPPAAPATPPAKPATPAATPPAANADPAATIEIPEAALTLVAPAGWTPRKAPAPGIPLMLLSTPAKPGARVNTITVATDAPPASDPRPSPAQLADDAARALKSTIPDAKVIETTDPKVGGQRARQVVVAGHRDPGKTDVRLVILCFYGNDKAVTLTAESPAADFDTLKAAVDQVVASATLKPGSPLRKPQ